MGSALRRARGRRGLWRDEDGIAILETIIVVPVILVFLVGILEFGALLFAKLEIEAGLNAAARYVARCQPGFGCTTTAAQNIAVFGNIAGTGSPRVEGWTAADVTIVNGGLGGITRVSTSFDYAGSPLLGLIGIATIPVTAFHEERYTGW